MRTCALLTFLTCCLLVACSLSPTTASPNKPSPTATYPPPASPKYIYPSCQPAIIPNDVARFSSFPTRTPRTSDTLVSLRSLAENRALYIGAAVSSTGLSDSAYTSLLSREFNMLTPENSLQMKFTQAQPGQFNFTQSDTFLAFAQANHMAYYGHALVWDGELPGWITQRSFTREEMMSILCTHIKSVVGHYRGQAYAWTVVNEPFDKNGLLRKTLFLDAIGPDYIAMAFQWANEADPAAILVLNETYAEGLSLKSQAVYALAQGLLKNNTPLHAIGMQMHVTLNNAPTPDELLANMQRLADLGLQVHITEMDIRTQYSQDTAPEISTSFTQIYRQTLAACLQVAACRVFTTWGVTDHYSWIPSWTGNPDSPLLFDKNYQPKPAYFALIELLK